MHAVLTPRSSRRSSLVRLASLAGLVAACSGGDNQGDASHAGAGATAGHVSSAAGGGGQSQAAAGKSGASAGTSAPATGGAGAGAGGRGGAAAPAGAGGQSGTAGKSGAGGAAGSAAGSGTLVNPAPGSKFFVGANFWNIDWEGSSDYFVNNVDWSSTQNPWQPALLSDLAPYNVLRFMDWNLINEADNPQASWDTRKHKTDMQNEPVAFEWQIDLCNRAKKDYWVNIPSQANAAYFTQLAQLIHDQLDPSLRVYVEWSNEVWNGGFPQRKYAAAQAKTLKLAGSDGAASYQVYQSVRAFEAFEAVFGKGSPRLVKVIAGQAASTGPCDAEVAAFKDATINPNGTKADAYAIAPYFRGDTIDALSNTGVPEAIGWVSDSAKCAKGAGWLLIAYEGGQDSYNNNDSSACPKLQRDPAMHDIYTKFLDGMVSAGLSGPFTQYTHSGDCWGLKQKTSDTLANSPKYKGVVDWLAAHP
jgi:hypothetical protein